MPRGGDNGLGGVEWRSLPRGPECMYEYMHDVHMQVPFMYVRMYMVQAMRSYNYNVQVQISVHQ